MSMASPASAASSSSSSSFRDFYQAGVAFQRGGRHAQASRCFRCALEGLDPHEQGKVLAFKALWNLSQASLALGDDAAGEEALRSALSLLRAGGDDAEQEPEEEKALREGRRLVHLNLSAVLALRGGHRHHLEEALAIAEEGVTQFPFDCALGVQQGALLRRLGRQAEALRRAWAALAHHRGEHQQHQQHRPPPPSIPAPLTPTPAATQALHVLMVKVGRKYPPDHANRLARAVRRHLLPQPPLQLRVLCLADDAAGLYMGAIDAVVPFPLAADEQELPGWWAKAALFSPALPVPPGAPILYFDLDTVLLRDLRPLLSFFDGRTTPSLAALGSESLQSEGGRPGGLNTSVMLWRAHDPRWTPLYVGAGPEVVRVVSKFDWWVEMIAARGGGGVVGIEERWPGLVVDYQSLVSADGGGKPGEPAAGAVVFPLRAKPADLVDSVPWIGKHWR